MHQSNLKRCDIDIGIIKMFINIIYNKDKTASSRNINEILLRIKSFLTDIKNNYLDNDAYTKINIVAKSNKYTNLDVKTINRHKCIFKMLKYNICTDNSATDNCVFLMRYKCILIFINHILNRVILIELLVLICSVRQW